MNLLHSNPNVKRKALHTILCVMLTLISSFAFFASRDILNREMAMYFVGTESLFPLTLMRLTLLLPTQHFGSALFAVAAFFLFRRHEVWPLKKAEFVFAASFTLAYYVGITFTLYSSFGLLTSSTFALLYSALLFMGFFPFFYVTTCFLTEILGSRKINNQQNTNKDTDSKLAMFFGEKRPFLAPFGLFLLAWLPFFLLYFPGNLMNDSVRQLMHFMGDTMPNFHPLTSTFFMGILYRIGLAFDSANMGLALITVAHNLITAAAFALALVYMRRWGVPLKLRLTAMLFFAFFPVFGIWPQTILNTTHGTPAMLVFVLLYINLIREHSRKNLILCILAAILASLLRSEAIYIVSLSLAALAFLPGLSAKLRLQKLAVAVMVVVCSQLIWVGTMRATDHEASPVWVMLSIPFQQTARFVRYHEVRYDELRVLEETFYGFHELSDLYHPWISDPVKARFIEGSDLVSYFRVWAAMGLRAPLTYLEAAIAVSFSYVVPFGPDWNIVFPEASWDAIPNLSRPDIGYVFSSQTARAIPLNIIELFERLPVINLFFHTGNYTWALAFFALMLIKKRRLKPLFYFVPAFVIILTCIASPIHGFWRYYLPVLYMFPVLAAIVITEWAREYKP